MKKTTSTSIIRIILAVLLSIGIAYSTLAKEKRRIFRIAFTYPFDINLYMPELHSFSHYREISGQLFLPLVKQRVNGSVIPGVAKDWRWINNDKSLVFILKEGIKWSDGSELTAHDFEFSLKKIAGYHAIFSELSEAVIGWREWNSGKFDVPIGVKAISKYELQFDMHAPKEVNIEVFSFVVATKRHNWEPLLQPSRAWINLDSPPSYGPYKVKAISHDKMILEKNPFYHDADNVHVEEIEYLSGEKSNGLDEYASGEIDVLLGPLGKQKRWIVDKYQNNTRVVGSPKLYFLLPDKRKKLMNNPNLLDALYLVLDRKSFGEAQFGSVYHHIESAIPKGFAGYQKPPSELDNVPFLSRLEKAKLMMQGLGYTKENPLKLKLGVTTTVPGYRDISGFVRGSWKVINVEVEFIRFELFSDMLKAFSDGILDLTVASYNADYYNQMAYLHLPLEYATLTSLYIPKEYRMMLEAIRAAKTQSETERLVRVLDEFIMRTKLFFPIVTDNELSLVGSHYEDEGMANAFSFPRVAVQYFKPLAVN